MSAEADSGVAERFRQLREKENLSQRDFAKALDVSPSVISEIERGAREPSRKVFLAVHKLFSCDLNWLLLGIGNLDETARGSSAKEREIEELKKSIGDMETEIRKLEMENKEMASELMERMRQLISIQQQKLSGA